MIYLTTGANGAGKTLLTLKEVREKSIKESRPVYYNGRFALKLEIEKQFGWQRIDAKDWQSVPDGAIFLFDECHNDFPVRRGTQPPPPHVEALAEHRRRGFDFYLITQHPLNLDSFIRRLIGAPGWHRHLKRASGAALVAQLEWSSVNDNCQKPGAGESGSVRMVPYPREVYAWYDSTSLDTAKVRVPFQVWVLLFTLLAVPLCAYLAYTFIAPRVTGDKNTVAESSGVKPSVHAASAPSLNTPRQSRPNDKPQLTAAEYVATYKPRIDGLPHTAARYDEVTRPVEAPFPAACMESKSTGCKCFTQQATLLRVPDDLCRQIVTNGYFMDWHKAATGGLSGQQGQRTTTVHPPGASTSSAPQQALALSPASSSPSSTSTTSVTVSTSPVFIGSNVAASEVPNPSAPNAHPDADVRQFMAQRRALLR